MSQVHFFQKAFPHQTSLAGTAMVLESKGIEFVVNFYNILAKLNGKVVGKAMLPKSTASMLKGNLSPEDMEVSVKAVHKMFAEAGEKVMIIPMAPDSLTPKYGGPIPDDALIVKVPAKKGGVTIQTNEPKPKPHKMKLADAEALLQLVGGTSGGSNYYAVAIGDQMNIGLRRTSEGLSFRAEKINAHVKPILLSFGFGENGPQHMSLHVQVNEKTLRAKTFGSVLLGLQGMGVKFKRQVVNVYEVPED